MKPDMNDPLLHYVYDPLCGWCYAASPLVKAAVANGIGIKLHGGGLWGIPTSLVAEKRSHIQMNDQRIAELTGLPFEPAYLNKLLDDPATIFWSHPTIAAVLAAGALRNGADLDMLHAIQTGHYVQGRKVVEEGVLANLAIQIGLAADDFATTIRNIHVAEHIHNSRHLMTLHGIKGFPGFVLEHEGRFTRVRHERFYGNPEAFATELRTITKLTLEKAGSDQPTGSTTSLA
ncbi:DsbA family protein [Leeia aquatica]|uniref:DsbA family protein n=1 Tax=Leeia aquatica TaxID=2725557 RepID=A0A847RWX5_9NEIS|nr:DsbA family protein [Leeia aquatica]NLR75660.1 DsbA family protein [Leeia aquatica]